MKRELTEIWTRRLAELEAAESALTLKFEGVENELSGLIDFDLGLALVVCRLDIAILGVSVRSRGSSGGERLFARTSRAGREAVELYDHLKSSANESLTDIDDFPLDQQIKSRLEALILGGGGALFDIELPSRGNSSEIIASVIADAVAKYAPPDDQYESIFGGESLLPIINRFFPGFVAGANVRPPYGVDEAEIESTRQIVLPLSQAIAFYRQILEGVSSDQKKTEEIEHRLSELEAISVRPRPQPLILPTGYYTEGLTRFTRDGEPLIPIALEASYSTGTNLDRVMELIRDEVVRKIAGKGLCEPLDAEIDRLRSLESGRRGNRMFPRSALDTSRWFSRVRLRYPQLQILEDKSAVTRFISIALHSRTRALRKHIVHAMSGTKRKQIDHRTLAN